MKYVKLFEAFIAEMTTGYAQDKTDKARKTSAKAKDILDNVKKAQQATKFDDYINPAIEKSVKAAGFDISKLGGRRVEITNFGHATSFLPKGKQHTGDDATFIIAIDPEGYKFTTGFPGMLDSSGLTKLKSIIATIQKDLKGK